MTDGHNGLEVVKVLQAAQYSVSNGGGRVELKEMTKRLSTSNTNTSRSKAHNYPPLTVSMKY